VLLHEKALYILRGLAEALRDAADDRFFTEVTASNQRRTRAAIRRTPKKQHQPRRQAEKAHRRRTFPLCSTTSLLRAGTGLGCLHAVAKCRSLPQRVALVEDCRILSKIVVICRNSPQSAASHKKMF
jgi:hypothetical protein